MKRTSECEESRLNHQDQIVCELLGNVLCENDNYLFYTTNNCPKLKGTAYDPIINTITFRTKQKVVETVIRVFKRFLPV